MDLTETQIQQLNRVNEQQQQPNQQSQQNQQQQQQQNQQAPYTVPGILHYLQYEWHRFEVERQEWDVEKAELSARIALLEGEKRSHENLKRDLIRRIKMLEYCLRMERAKFHKLKHGTDPPASETQQTSGEDQQKAQNDEDFTAGNNNSSTVTYGRELLRHYLQEIGYTDTIIDLRSNRVRSLLGIVENQVSSSPQQTTAPTQPQQQQPLQQHQQNNQPNSSPNSSSSNNQKNHSGLTATMRNNVHSNNKRSPFAAALLSNKSAGKQPGDVGDAEASVLATFGFLYDHDGARDMSIDEEEDEMSNFALADREATSSTSEYSYFDKEHGEAIMRQRLDILNNGKIPTSTGDSDSIEESKDTKRLSKIEQNQAGSKASANNWCPNAQKIDVVDIGELATLTTLDSDNDYRRKQWSAKFRLQSHYDCVRALKFSDSDSLLVTASEDETIKLWHLSRTSSSSGKSRQPNLPLSINAISSLEGSTYPYIDIEPIHTYRGHTSRILTVTICKNHIFSGAQNGELIRWKVVPDTSSADQYDKFDSTLLECKYVGHDDAVWAVETVDQPDSATLLCSASADRTIKIWTSTGDNKEPIGLISLESSPTCIAKIPFYNVCHSGADIAVSSCDGKIRLYDIAECLDKNDTQPKATFESDQPHRINSIVIHPTLSYMASADSNHDIKFWDLKTRKFPRKTNSRDADSIVRVTDY